MSSLVATGLGIMLLIQVKITGVTRGMYMHVGSFAPTDDAYISTYTLLLAVYIAYVAIKSSPL